MAGLIAGLMAGLAAGVVAVLTTNMAVNMTRTDKIAHAAPNPVENKERTC
jgi:F0F1-type ATP synthase assembly protein I